MGLRAAEDSESRFVAYAASVAAAFGWRGGLVLESFTRMNQRRPPQSTSNPSELAVFRKSCNSNRKRDVLNFGGFMNFDQRRDTKRSPSEWPTGSAGRKIAGADLWA
jgi:hypothetical protein